jgi:transposase-like protein
MNIISVYSKFPTKEKCIDHLEHVRWNDQPTCPYCKSKKQTPMKIGRRYHCYNCKTSFSVTVGTIFHNTKLDLQKWFLAISLILNAKKGMPHWQSWYTQMAVNHLSLGMSEFNSQVGHFLLLIKNQSKFLARKICF